MQDLDSDELRDLVRAEMRDMPVPPEGYVRLAFALQREDDDCETAMGCASFAATMVSSHARTVYMIGGDRQAFLFVETDAPDTVRDIVRQSIPEGSTRLGSERVCLHCGHAVDAYGCVACWAEDAADELDDDLTPEALASALAKLRALNAALRAEREAR